MAPAREELAGATPAASGRPTRAAAAVQRGRRRVSRRRGGGLRRLVSQVSSPVRWDLCLATMRDLGVTAVIELPPAGDAGRAGEAGVEGRRHRRAGPEDARRPRPRPRPDRRRARHAPRPSTPPTGGWSWRRSRGTFSPAEIAGGHPPPGRQPARLRSARRREEVNVVAPATTASSPSGWCRTATSSTPGEPIVRLYPEVLQ